MKVRIILDRSEPAFVEIVQGGTVDVNRDRRCVENGRTPQVKSR